MLPVDNPVIDGRFKCRKWQIIVACSEKTPALKAGVFAI